ncbi:MAG: hypothetical protein CHACPFDD_02793 [Phycisphaerae bacterium]|nr:hypothetical protein [Phycisphaerae bacterium]
MNQQHTIQTEAELSGRGLFTGGPVHVRFLPAPADSGIVFVRRDQPQPVSIPARIDNLSKRARRTSLRNGTVSIETVEHCLAAIRGVGIDNLVVELDNAELPGVDGSSLPFVETLVHAGIVEQESPRRLIEITETVHVRDGDAELVAWPGTEKRLEIIYELNYGGEGYLPTQVHSFDLVDNQFVTEIAAARTFVFEHEVKQFHAAGLGTHLTYKDILVIGPHGPIENEFRYPNECVRHKILDLIGDLMLCGAPVCGKIYARKSGHNLNHELARKLLECAEREQLRKQLAAAPKYDIRAVQRLLPHRYPMLLVDRVIEVDGDRRAVGIKNVTINEPYFTGHYPRQPIMPGVLIIEAMAQLGGILMAQNLENTGKVAVLLSLDRVKFRKPAVPGDQLILEAESMRIKSRTGQVKCQARTDGELVAEAMIRFMLVDADPA